MVCAQVALAEAIRCSRRRVGRSSSTGQGMCYPTGVALVHTPTPPEPIIPADAFDAARLRHQAPMELSSLRDWAKSLRRQTLVAYFAARDPRTPWFARVLALLVAAYALSPIDLIPDFIPLLGYLDDLVIVPLGLLLVLRLVPEEVKQSARVRAAAVDHSPTSHVMVIAIVAIWVLAAGVLGLWVWRGLRA